MGKFLRTLMIGVGIGLLIAPMRGEEMRQLLMDRFQQLTGSSTGSTPSQQPSGSSSTSSSRQSSTSSGNAAPSPLKQFAASSEEHAMMYTPPTTGTFEPAYPDYTNPEQK